MCFAIKFTTSFTKIPRRNVICNKAHHIIIKNTGYLLDTDYTLYQMKMGGTEHHKKTSSETQGQSVGSGEKAGRKFLSTGERALGYQLSPNYFQKFKRKPAPDWAQKMLCIVVPNQ